MSNRPYVPPTGEHHTAPNRQNNPNFNFSNRPILSSDNNRYISTEAHPQSHLGQRPYLSGPNDNNRMPQPSRPFNSVTSSISPAQQGPYQQGSANLNRSKSLTRPERQRPRPGMINNSNVNKQPNGSRYRRSLHRKQNNDINSNRLNTNQPMSRNLQTQLAQQKQQHQMAIDSLSAREFSDEGVPDEELEKEARVLNNWWAWIAFLVTCCFPNYIIHHCFGKPNKNMQQAWREKVSEPSKIIKKKKLFYYANTYSFNYI